MDVSRFSLPFHDPLAVYTLIAGIVILIPVVARRLKLPPLVGLIAAGMAVGPYGLSLIERDQTILLPATVGILYIMFLAGLEIDLLQINRRKADSAVFGLFTFFIPLIMGTVGGRFLIHLDWPSAVLLATMFSSHTLLTYPVVSRFGLIKSRASITAVGGTIITDILAILILAVIAGQARGALNLFFLLELAAFLIFVVLMLRFIIPRLGKWFFRRLAPDSLVQFAFVLTVLFAFSFLAEVLSMEKIIGAFFAGLALNRLIPEKSGLMNRLRFVGNALFIPVFLISVGMLINFDHLLHSPTAWLVAAVMSAIAIVSKAAAALVSGGLLRFDLKEMGLLFGMSVNQAAATLAAVLVGYQLKLFNEDILSGTLFMILLTSLTGAVSTEQAGKKMALAEKDEPYTYAHRPERFMIAVKDQNALAALLDLAVFLRAPGSREALYPVHIIPDYGDTETDASGAEQLLSQAFVHSSVHDIPVYPVTRTANRPDEGVMHSMKENLSLIHI